MSKNTYKTALYGLCIALAFILSYVEVLIPIQGLVPGHLLSIWSVSFWYHLPLEIYKVFGMQRQVECCPMWLC